LAALQNRRIPNDAERDFQAMPPEQRIVTLDTMMHIAGQLCANRHTISRNAGAGAALGRISS
jgi:hypothetical protein